MMAAAPGFRLPRLLLPRPGIDLRRWAVIACDQYTAHPEYWQQVQQVVGDAPSTLQMIFPEAYLNQADAPARIARIQQAMRRYLDDRLLQEHAGAVYVERQIGTRVRRGLMLELDLEHYDFRPDSTSLIRPTEGTIVERLAPRIEVRRDAALELPHILVLIDDPQRTVIEPVAQQAASLTKVYDFDLMLGSGHLRGYRVDDPRLEAQVVSALEALADPHAFAQKYGVSGDQGVLLFAMGDGNHSLATAKTIWEKIKAQVWPDHPARYALVEIENVHDAGLIFEPIHRVVFGVKEELSAALERLSGAVQITPCDAQEMITRVNAQAGAGQSVGLVTPQGSSVLTFAHPASNLPVGTLQAFLDAWLKEGKAEKIDYVHGSDVVTRLGAQPGNIGFYLPGMAKGDLFKTVIVDGALPRKTFSMGEAKEKRFYLEARRIA